MEALEGDGSCRRRRDEYLTGNLGYLVLAFERGGLQLGRAAGQPRYAAGSIPAVAGGIVGRGCS